MAARLLVIKDQHRNRRFDLNRKLGGSGGIKLWLVPNGVYLKARWRCDSLRATFLPKMHKRPLGWIKVVHELPMFLDMNEKNPFGWIIFPPEKEIALIACSHRSGDSQSASQNRTFGKG